MDREQLELLMEYIDESIGSAKEEVQGGDPYWRNRAADKVRNKLFETLGETDE